MQKNVTMHIKLTKHDYERIKFLAEANNRTIHGMAKHILLMHLDSFKEQTK